MPFSRKEMLYCGLAATSLWATWITLFVSGLRISEEHGAMENQQAACLAIAALLFLVSATLARPRVATLFTLSLALFCLMFLLGELELRRTGAPEWLKEAVSLQARTVWLGALWLGLLISARHRPFALLAQFQTWCRSTAGIVMLVACFLYVVAWLLELQFQRTGHQIAMFIEELDDSMATLLMMCSALLTALRIYRRRQDVATNSRLEPPAAA